MAGPLSRFCCPLAKGTVSLQFISPEQLAGVLRAVLASGGAWAIAKGYVTPDNWEWLSAGALTFMVASWSWYAKRPKKD